jgi:hypothetical protein
MSTRNTREILFRGLSTLFFAAALLGCEAQEQEQEVVSVVSDGIALLESQSVGKALRLTTEDFLAQPGRLSKNAVTRKLVRFYAANGNVDVMHPAPEVELDDALESALVSMPFVVAKKGASAEDLDDLYDDQEAWEAAASEYAAVQRADISLVKQNERWLVRTVRFTERQP